MYILQMLPSACTKKIQRMAKNVPRLNNSVKRMSTNENTANYAYLIIFFIFYFLASPTQPALYINSLGTRSIKEARESDSLESAREG